MDATRLFNLFFLNLPVYKPLCDEYLKTHFKTHNINAHLKFLYSCYNEQVIPMSILPKRLKNQDNYPFGTFEKHCLQLQIQLTKEAEAEADGSFKKLKHVKVKFSTCIPVNYISIVLDYVYKVLRYENNIVVDNLKHKLDKLIRDSDWNNHGNNDNVTNLSSKILSNETISALSYCSNFSIINKKTNPLHIVMEYHNWRSIIAAI